MNTTQILCKIRELEEAGLLHNLWDDFLFHFRDNPAESATLGCNLGRLRQIARRQELTIDEALISAGEKFIDWVEARP